MMMTNFVVGKLYKVCSGTRHVPIWGNNGSSKLLGYLIRGDVFFVVERIQYVGVEYVRIVFGELLGEVKKVELVLCDCKLIM